MSQRPEVYRRHKPGRQTESWKIKLNVCTHLTSTAPLITSKSYQSCKELVPVFKNLTFSGCWRLNRGLLVWMNSYVIFLKDTFFHHKVVLLQVLPFPLQVSQLTFRHIKQHKTQDCCELKTGRQVVRSELSQKIQSVSCVPKHD